NTDKPTLSGVKHEYPPVESVPGMKQTARVRGYSANSSLLLLKMRIALLVLTVGVGFFSALPTIAKEHRESPGKELFEDGMIPHIEIHVSPGAIEQLRQHPRTYVLGEVEEKGFIYTNVSIRLKGSVGSFRPIDQKPAFTVNFGRAAEGQKFHGLK